MGEYSTITVPADGTQLAYEVLGSEHVGVLPLVFVGGMTSCRGDWQLLSSRIAKNRPVLVYDHRGMGDSSCRKDDLFAIETLARDLYHLLQSLGWKKLALCGHSMGGIVVQQLLFLPYHSVNPTPLPFQVSHVILSATLARPIRDPRYGVKFAPRPTGPLTMEQVKTVVAQTMAADFDPEWWNDKANQARKEKLITRGLFGRPFRTIVQQKKAATHFDFSDLHTKLSRETQFLVIRGELDQIIPFSDDFFNLIPWARPVSSGTSPGEVPHYRFGHNWIEYFNPETWTNVLEVFLHNSNVEIAGARL
ncbi:Alpha/Beta hydrolase protein [Hygrophoropsis aurantiaca]|uniref:Alpha/Beta hydrolase protein n=1 Tax=Hygrophoropsis aurantiaca TaxID=72124 RepID=A0ACB8AKV9_9AGAM|nr:Alpha/Beta hydrolase protein [Hygrophoropsis aurantiaca]